MKKYTFTVVITEGCDVWWESMEGRTGCDEVLEVMKDELFNYNPVITLSKYEESI